MDIVHTNKHKENNMEIKVSEVVVEIGNKKVSLTPDQARELRDALNQLLGESKEIVKEYVPYPYQPYPYRWWTIYPTWTNTNTNTGSYTINMTNTPTAQ